MNTTPLVVLLVLAIAAAGGGWYKYFDAQDARTDQARQAGAIVTPALATLRTVRSGPGRAAVVAVCGGT